MDLGPVSDPTRKTAEMESHAQSIAATHRPANASTAIIQTFARRVNRVVLKVVSTTAEAAPSGRTSHLQQFQLIAAMTSIPAPPIFAIRSTGRAPIRRKTTALTRPKAESAATMARISHQVSAVIMTIVLVT